MATKKGKSVEDVAAGGNYVSCYRVNFRDLTLLLKTNESIFDLPASIWVDMFRVLLRGMAHLFKNCLRKCHSYTIKRNKCFENPFTNV